MDNKLYAIMKTVLLEYSEEFGKPHNFNDLFSFSKQYKHGLTFKPFVVICQNMGVYSVVKRLDTGRCQRVLVYMPENDSYLNGDVSIVERCITCNGSGVVKTTVALAGLN